MRVVVNEQHIANSVWGDGDFCAVALAVKEAAKDEDLYCESKFVLECEGEAAPFGILPDFVREKIRTADFGGKMEPFEFEMVTILENPKAVNRAFDEVYYPGLFAEEDHDES